MKKLKSDLKAVHEGFSRFRYTNIIVLLFIFLAGFIVSEAINQPRYIVLYAQSGGPAMGEYPVWPLPPNQNQQNNNRNQNQPVANPTFGCLSGQPCASPAPSRQIDQNQQNQNNNQNPQSPRAYNPDMLVPQNPNNNHVPVNNNHQQPQNNNDGIIQRIQNVIEQLKTMISQLFGQN